MYEVARKFFEEYEVTAPEDLFALDAVPVAAGQREGQRARYEVRCRRIRRAEVSVIAIAPPMTAEPWWDLLHFLFHTRLEELQQEQPGAEWKLVGVLIRQHDLSKTRVDRGGAGKRLGVTQVDQVASGVWDERLENMTKRQGGAVTIVDEKSVELVADLVFADLSQSVTLANPADKHGDYKPGSAPMEKYAEGRLLHTMPFALRTERKEAEAVMGQIAAIRERNKPAVVDPLARFEPEALRALLADTPAEKVATLLGVTVEALLARAEAPPAPAPSKKR